MSRSRTLKHDPRLVMLDALKKGDRMRRVKTLIVVLGLVVAAGCKKGEKAEPAPKGETPTPTGTDPAKGDPKAPAAPAGDVAADVGVAAGGIEREATEGPA